MALIKSPEWRKKIIGLIVLVVILFLIVICYKLVFPANGTVNKTVKYLESEGYECAKEVTPFFSESEGKYVCTDEDRNDNKREYVITWRGGIINFFKTLVHHRDSLFDDSIDVGFWYYNDEGDYLYVYPEDLSESYAYVLQDSKTNDHLCLYVTEGSDEDTHIPLGDKSLEVDYDHCDDEYDIYLDEINDSLDEVRDFLEEMEMD